MIKNPKIGDLVFYKRGSKAKYCIIKEITDDEKLWGVWTHDKDLAKHKTGQLSYMPKQECFLCEQTSCKERIMKELK